MTVEQKINEASLWLEHIHFYSPDISIVKYYFGAFLSATASIQDYILAEANEFYQLELPMDKTWYPSHFEREAKKQAENRKPNALEFYKWWVAWTSSSKVGKVGEVFNNIRNMEIHKKKQQPVLNVLILPMENKPYEKPHKVPVTITGEGSISSIDELNVSIDLLKPKILEKYNKIREEKGDHPADNIQVAEYLQVEGLPGMGSLVDCCGIWLQYWIDFVKIARELFEESKTGKPKTGLS